MNITKKEDNKYLEKIIKENKNFEVGCSSGFMLFDLKKKRQYLSWD